MRYSFAQVAPFVAKWKRLRLTDEDLQALEAEIGARPNAGAVMAGTGGLRKLRFAPPSWNRGKSGSTRVCYVVFGNIGVVYLLTLFAKNEKDNLANSEKRLMRRWIEDLKNALIR